ncbi:protein RRP6-like 2 isoform X2 [Rutidosis leptorrhynchoides]|uniref:protein RRP6-like 2 isoform X2 n=1 Tax=Rutidosis leptorrhynchoides TaxID=125765 RepID=UPI003A996B7C
MILMPIKKTTDGSKYIHPLEKFKFNDFVNKNVSKFEPIVPPPVNETPLTFVQEEKELKELVRKLRNVNEFAVDLEHNQYRSFQGLTCLMQISTRTEDFIVDTLKLHDHIGPYMRDVFKDPTKKKVMHGADKDIMWLQRDFGIYVCNMFDTGQASRVLNMEKNSLEHLLMYFCGVPLNKEYQTADWRLRPLTNDMLKYAREDTHYLLFVHDLMIKRLLSSSPDPKFPELLVMEVYRRSYDVCLKLYEKEPFNNKSYLNVYGLHDADLNGQQLSIVEALCAWRDIVARSADESTGYILSNKNVIEIAKQMPTTTIDLYRVLKFPNIHIQQNPCSILSIIQNSRNNASAFDEIAKKLKQERLDNAALRTGKKRSEEASYMLSGSNNVVGNQFASAVDKKRLDNDTAKALLNISFGSYKRKPESLGPTMQGHAKARETVKCNEPVDARAANEVEKNASVRSSSFQKCLQTASETKMLQAGFKRGGPSQAL